MVTSNAHLPLSLSAFVGREAELEKLAQLEQLGARLITLTGPGGAGKTRLASEFARHRVDAGKRVFFVDLARESTVAGTILDILAPGTEASNAAAIEALRRHASPGLMVVLDGLEQVLDQAADIVPAILGIEGVIVLGTSREALRLRGEQVVRVGALSPEEAMELFELRARSLMPEFEAGRDSGEAIREIVARVDGLPLGIELAAARVNVLPPRGLADRLTNRMSALKSKDRDRPERHRSIAATARWSWELLSEAERHVLMQLASFRGNFTLEAAEKIVYLKEHEVLEVIEVLVDRSIVEPLVDRTFRIYQTVHGLAFHELGSDEWKEAVYRRHANYFVAHVLETPRHLRGELREDLMELILAATRTRGAERAAAVAAKASIVAERGGVTSLVEEVLGAVDETDDPIILAELFLAASRGMNDRMELERARELALRSVEQARKAKDSELEVQALVTLIISYMWEKEHEEAAGLVDELEDALRLSKSIGAETRARSVSARLFLELGDIAEAEDQIALALNRARGSEDAYVLARTLADAGMWRVQRGSWSAAESLLTEAIGLFDELEESRHLPRALLALARIKTVANDLQTARELYLRTERVARDFGLVGLRLDALIGTGSLRCDPGDRAYLVRAIDISTDTGARQTELIARSMLMLFDMRFSSFPLAQHQARRIDGDQVPEVWRQTVVALEALLANWQGDQVELPSPSGSPWLSTLVELVDRLAKSSSSSSGKEIAEIRELLEQLSEKVDESLAAWPAAHVVHVLETLVDERFAAADALTLELDREGRSFTPPGGEEVDYSRRGALRRVLVGLAEAADTSPGEALTLDEVLELGWPGEIVTPDAGASRVYSAVRTLRNHGLDEVLLTNDEGYLFVPELQIVWIES